MRWTALRISMCRFIFHCVAFDKKAVKNLVVKGRYEKVSSKNFLTILGRRFLRKTFISFGWLKPATLSKS